MKNILSLISVVSLLTFGACRKVIEIDLNSADPKIVITGILTSNGEPCKVSISKTVDYYNGGAPPAVSAATVILSDDAGNTEQLSELSPGNYYTNTMQGVPGRTYTLSVTVDGKTYVSRSTMQQPVPIDTILGAYSPSNFDSGGYIGTASFQDPAGFTNYYRVRTFVNGVLQESPGVYRILNDELSDGNIIEAGIYSSNAAPGDTIKVQLGALEEKAYRYFEAISLMVPGVDPTQGPPSNPDYQFTNNGLGYFMAVSVVERSFVVQ